ILWRQAKAGVLARRGELQAAEALAREAVEHAEQTDMLNNQAGARLSLAAVLELAQRHDDAFAAVEEALALYERKGNVAMVERARARLAELRSASRMVGWSRSARRHNSPSPES